MSRGIARYSNISKYTGSTDIHSRDVSEELQRGEQDIDAKFKRHTFGMPVYKQTLAVFRRRSIELTHSV